MGEVIDALTLILDNTAGLYERIQEAARNAVVEDLGYGVKGPDMDEYRSMYRDRSSYVIEPIGVAIAYLLDDELTRADLPNVWNLFIRQALELHSGDTRRALGEHYLPEPDDMADLLASDDDDDDDDDDDERVCGYCGGAAVRVDSGWAHKDAGDRVQVSGAGDFVSARHNQAGTAVLTEDLFTREEYEECN